MEDGQNMDYRCIPTTVECGNDVCTSSEDCLTSYDVNFQVCGGEGVVKGAGDREVYSLFCFMVIKGFHYIGCQLFLHLLTHGLWILFRFTITANRNITLIRAAFDVCQLQCCLLSFLNRMTGL